MGMMAITATVRSTRESESRAEKDRDFRSGSTETLTMGYSSAR